MAHYLVGDMIYENRVVRGYSQEELCFGICSTSSLSRIENNLQVPGKKLFDALMQRLGVSEAVYGRFISREEMELFRLKQELIWKLENLDFEHLDALTEEMERRIHGRNDLDRQYLLFVKASILKNRKGAAAEVLCLLLDALHIKMPGFAAACHLKKRLLTFDEITILNGIALAYAELGEREQELNLLLELKLYLESHQIDEEEKARKYPMILYNLSLALGSGRRYQEAYELCGEGVDYCISHNKLAVLPFLLNNRACAAAELGKRTKAREFFQQAVMLFQVCKKEQFAIRIQTEARKRYGLEL